MIRQLRTVYSNMYCASIQHLGMTIYAKERKKLHATNCQTDGIWFGKFALGMEKRMGHQIVQDLDISIEVKNELQDLLEADWRDQTPPRKDGRCVKWRSSSSEFSVGDL
jgi:hypothetical protein